MTTAAQLGAMIHVAELGHIDAVSDCLISGARTSTLRSMAPSRVTSASQYVTSSKGFKNEINLFKGLNANIFSKIELKYKKFGREDCSLVRRMLQIVGTCLHANRLSYFTTYHVSTIFISNTNI